jgi:hypothetical protein
MRLDISRERRARGGGQADPAVSRELGVRLGADQAAEQAAEHGADQTAEQAAKHGADQAANQAADQAALSETE